jgi:hypothetical protein
VEAILAFGAMAVSLALAVRMAIRWHVRHASELLAWSAGMFAYAVACAALGWGTAAGWDTGLFRVYFLFGGLLTPPLLAAGSLLLKKQGWAIPLVSAYTALSIGVVTFVSVDRVSGKEIPDVGDQLDFMPGRLVAVIGNVAGTVVVIVAALLTIRARPFGNLLIMAAMVVASVGSLFSGVALAAAVAATAVLLYGGFALPSLRRSPQKD